MFQPPTGSAVPSGAAYPTAPNETSQYPQNPSGKGSVPTLLAAASKTLSRKGSRVACFRQRVLFNVADGPRDVPCAIVVKKPKRDHERHTIPADDPEAALEALVVVNLEVAPDLSDDDVHNIVRRAPADREPEVRPESG
jgi:hypothetical protein